MPMHGGTKKEKTKIHHLNPLLGRPASDKLNVISRRRRTDHRWYFHTQSQCQPDYTLEGTQHPVQDKGNVQGVTPSEKCILRGQMLSNEIK